MSGDSMEKYKWYDLIGTSTAWIGHIDYIYEQIPVWRPKVVVELGVFLGHSLGTMAQSCLDHNLSTKLYGIDHFIGDEHAGSYGMEVEYLARKVMDLYPNVSLIKKTFNEAAEDWKDPIDLLHIDGRHYYEDIKEDFTNWEKFVPKGGHIILHDTQEVDRDFGIKRFFKELQEEHPDWGFAEREVSHGLGIVCKGAKLTELGNEQDGSEILYK